LAAHSIDGGVIVPGETMAPPRQDARHKR
jgi:hypothetical protein